MARGPTLRIPNVAAALKGDDAIDFARDVRENPLISGRLVDVAFSADNLATARHGLGRRLRGGLVVGASTGHTDDLTVITPEAADAAGAAYDPDTLVTVSTQSNYTGTIRVWVF